MSLPADEREQLADELYESIADATTAPEWQSAWTAQIERRLDDVASRKVDAIDADEVHADLQRELHTTRR